MVDLITGILILGLLVSIISTIAICINYPIIGLSLIGFIILSKLTGKLVNNYL